MRYGSAYFFDFAAAVAYYAAQHETAEDVQRKIEAAEIHVGKLPPMNPGEFCYLEWNGERRFFVCDADELCTHQMVMGATTLGDNGAALHKVFYRQIVKAAGVKPPAALVEFCRDRIAAGRMDSAHLNGAMSLESWDSYAAPFRARISAELKKRGDFWSLSGGLCTMKQAVKMELEKAEAPAA